jgi:T5SS/PEP-CTERM-associated repeat protein
MRRAPDHADRTPISVRLRRSLVAAALVVGVATHASGQVVDTGEVVVGAGGDLQIGITTTGSRVVDGVADGPYPSATLGVEAGSVGELGLLNGAGFSTTGAFVVGEMGQGLVSLSGQSQLETGGARLGQSSTSLVTSFGNSVVLDDSSWINTGLLEIGLQSRVELFNGSSLSTDGITLRGWNGTGTRLTIDGSSVVNTGTTSLVQFVNGSTLTIQNGGHLSDAGGQFNLGSTVLVTDPGSLWQTGALTGGSHGGLLDIQAGGRVLADSVALLSEQVVRMQVNGAGSTLDVTGEFALGGCCNIGTGIGDVTGGGLLRSATTVLGNTAGAGILTIAGSGSQLDTGLLDIGIAMPDVGYGRSSLTVSAAATATTTDAYIGCGAECSVFVDGPGSLWTSTGTVYVGRESGGTLWAGAVEVTQGSRVDVAQQMVIESTGRLALLAGTVTSPLVDVAGGLLSGDGTIDGSLTNAGTLAPGAGVGALLITGDLTQDPAGTLSIELGGTSAGATYDVLTVLGTSFLGGALEVLLEPGFVPALGDRFDVLVGNDLVGAFDAFVGLDLGGGLRLDPRRTPTGFSLVAVPEPGTGMLVGLGLVWLAGRRRRLAWDPRSG